MFSGQNFMIQACGDFILNDPRFMKIKPSLTKEDFRKIGDFLRDRETFMDLEALFIKPEFQEVPASERTKMFADVHILREQLTEKVIRLTPKLLPKTE